jgi:hypothetical protein
MRRRQRAVLPVEHRDPQLRHWFQENYLVAATRSLTSIGLTFNILCTLSLAS